MVDKPHLARSVLRQSTFLREECVGLNFHSSHYAISHDFDAICHKVSLIDFSSTFSWDYHCVFYYTRSSLKYKKAIT